MKNGDNNFVFSTATVKILRLVPAHSTFIAGFTTSSTFPAVGQEREGAAGTVKMKP